MTTRLTINNRIVIVENRSSKLARKKRKPTKPRVIRDPAEIARLAAENSSASLASAAALARNPAEWGVSPDTLKHEDVGDRRESLAEGERRIERFDCFALMVARAPDGTRSEVEAKRDLRATLHYVRRYQGDIGRLHKSAGTPQTGVVVDFGRGGDELGSIAAGERLRAVEALMGGQSRKLMRAICENDIGTSGRKWRFMVESVTGERNDNAQGALVRAAMHNTADAYREIDNDKRGVRAG